MTPTLAVLGAGPKAVAVAAKSAELRAMGVPAPDVVVVERTGVGANWTAAGGWTDGEHRLGTSPEKDVGFPYRSALVPRRNAELDTAMITNKGVIEDLSGVPLLDHLIHGQDFIDEDVIRSLFPEAAGSTAG